MAQITDAKLCGGHAQVLPVDEEFGELGMAPPKFPQIARAGCGWVDFRPQRPMPHELPRHAGKLGRLGHGDHALGEQRDGSRRLRAQGRFVVSRQDCRDETLV